MRTLLIFLSIGVFLTLIQYSNGAPRKPISPESDEDESVEKLVAKDSKPISVESVESDEDATKLKPVEVRVNENDQSSEEKQKVIDALEPKAKPNEPSSQSEEHDDDQANIPDVDNNNYRVILRDSDED